ncbi:hypothetical protein AVEN_34593-1 [Araneus ventricosus]|uniref:Uncharacterized protein n=1 Tax=Araneus ventricosus TaxID=182803 RepID=A0A4Y2AZ85_ARAVE|nr:hypothetical protein AVEN_34593-1 [Araneus ventricosus]
MSTHSVPLCWLRHGGNGRRLSCAYGPTYHSLGSSRIGSGSRGMGDVSRATWSHVTLTRSVLHIASRARDHARSCHGISSMSTTVPLAGSGRHGEWGVLLSWHMVPCPQCLTVPYWLQASGMRATFVGTWSPFSTLVQLP